MKRFWISAAASLVMMLNSACAVKPAPPPSVAVPNDWGQKHESGTAPLTSEWFRQFGSAELDGLIVTAAQNNWDLRAATARVRQADARARAAGAPLLPELSASANGVFYAGHAQEGSAHETDYSALLSASYEIDFWGKNRAGKMSAEALRDASEADKSVVALSTVTAVANTYFQVVALHERVELAKQTLSAATRLLEIIEARRTTQLANPVDVAQQRALVAGAEIQVKEIEQQELEQQAALSLLVGATSNSVAVTAHHLSDFTVPRVSPGLPTQLLTRRPDVFSAEANLRSAHADLLQARAAFFPSVTLTGNTGLQNPAVQAAVLTLPGVGPTVNVGAAVVQSIFDGGRLRAARDAALGKEEELLAQYQGAVLAAFWDVRTALSAIERLDRQENSQQQSLAESERALQGAQARYEAGSGDFLAVLDTQRTVLTAREQWTQYQLTRLQAAVGLCKALGGGWTQKH